MRVPTWISQDPVGTRFTVGLLIPTRGPLELGDFNADGRVDIALAINSTGAPYRFYELLAERAARTPACSMTTHGTRARRPF
jgi:hypothetical protein